MLQTFRTIKSKCKKISLLSNNYEVFQRTMQTVSLNDIPLVNATDIRKLLRQKGFAVQDGTTNFTTRCSICQGEHEASDAKMYVNKTTGYFLCPKCCVHGDWNILEKIVKKAKLDATTKEYIEKMRERANSFQKSWDKIVLENSSLAKLDDDTVYELFKLFEFPYHQDSKKVLADVRISPDHTTLYFPLKNNLEKVVGYRKVQAGREEEAENHGLHSAGLFHCRAVKGSKHEQAIIVPTVQDVLELAAHKVPGTYVWLGAGCALPPPALPALEPYGRLALWGDWGRMRGVADKLGEARCRFVRPADGLVSAREAAAAGLSLRALLEQARPAAHRAITTFAALREEVYAEITNLDKVQGVKWQRFPALTRLLGGHRRGELTVLTGPTGCGKTTLCAEMSLDLAQQGVTTLWGSFEIRNARLARTMLQQSAGVPLHRHLDRFHQFADDFQRLPLYYLAFHGQQPIKVVMEAVEHARYMHDIAHVIVDNVQFMLGVGGAPGGEDRYSRQDAVVAAFRTFATARHCHVTLVMHPRKERESEDLSTSSIFGSAKASQEADNVLIIQDKRLTAVRGKKFLQVAKNRYSGDLGVVPLEFDKEALSYQQRRRRRDEPERALDRSLRPFSVDHRHLATGGHHPDTGDHHPDTGDHRPATGDRGHVAHEDWTR